MTELKDIHRGECTGLYSFVFYVIESPHVPLIDTFSLDNELALEWRRPLYSGDRVGCDRFAVLRGNTLIGDEIMANDLDSDALARLVTLLGCEGKKPEEIQGAAY